MDTHTPHAGEGGGETFTMRPVAEADAAAIAHIYNHYITASTASFETTPVTAGEMQRRIRAIAAHFPYIVLLTPQGDVAGYCYAHPWKERAAYRHTLETTIYLHPGQTRRGAGSLLLQELIRQCRQLQPAPHALIACITQENAGSLTFHHRHGFREMSRFREVGFKDGRWLDVVDMEMLL